MANFVSEIDIFKKWQVNTVDENVQDRAWWKFDDFNKLRKIVSALSFSIHGRKKAFFSNRMIRFVSIALIWFMNTIWNFLNTATAPFRFSSCCFFFLFSGISEFAKIFLPHRANSTYEFIFEQKSRVLLN